MSHEPTPYDRVQNKWIAGAVMLWVISIVVAIATTADVVRSVSRDDRNDIAALRERVAVLESKVATVRMVDENSM